MFAINPDEADKSSRRLTRYLADAFFTQLVLTKDRFDPWWLLRWLRDEARRNATIRELNLLSDYYLDDIGVRRRVDLKTDDLVKRLRAGG